MGAVEIALTPLSELPRTADGKFRAVICEIPEDQLRSRFGPW
jgi:hypothetical protein